MFKPLSPEFYINPRCPPSVVPFEAACIDVLPGEMANVPKREAPASVIETNNSEAGEHLFAAEVRQGNEPVFFA